MGKRKNKEHKKVAAKTDIRQRHASDPAAQTRELTELAVLPTAGTPPLEPAYRPEKIASDEREGEMYSEVGSPPEHIDDPEKQAISSEKTWCQSLWENLQWMRTKTFFGVFGQLFIATSFATAPFHAITSAIFNNSAVLSAIIYMYRKNKEVRTQNTDLGSKITELRIHMKKNLDVDPKTIKKTKRPVSWKSLGLFELQKEPMLYLLMVAGASDIVSCVSTCMLVQSTEPTCIPLTIKQLVSQNNSGEASSCANDSSASSLVNPQSSCTLSITSNPWLKPTATITGIGAIALALPQVWAAHNLRRYQDELNKELKELQQVALEKLKERVATFRGEIAILEGSVATKDATMARLKEEIAILEAKIISFNESITIKDATIADLKGTISTDDETIADLVEMVDTRNETIGELNRSVAQFRKQSSREISLLRENIAEQDLTIRAQRQELTELRQQVQAARPISRLNSTGQAALLVEQWRTRSLSTYTVPTKFDRSLVPKFV